MSENHPADERFRATHLALIASLVPGGSPRVRGENSEHVSALARIDGGLPPIVVHRSTGRVLDGLHRMRAAALRGEREIEVTFFDGTDEEAFIYSIRANLAHGLVLSRDDRKAAARKVLASHPDWSDRLIARTVGLSPKTVAALRRPTEENPQMDVRRGLDGRSRKVSGEHTRRVIVGLLEAQPDSSLRQIARAAGVSPTTVLNVRKQREAETGARAPGRTERVAGQPSRRPRLLMSRISRDPLLRYSDSGKSLLRWLAQHSVEPGDCEARLKEVPVHCTESVAELADYYAQVWDTFAKLLGGRGRVDPSAAE